MVSNRNASRHTPSNREGFHRPEVEEALKTLRAPNARARMEAVATLTQAGPPAVPGLLNALDHPDSGVREAATRALQQIGSPAVQPLAERLMSHKPHVREAATAALKHIGDRGAAEALRDLLYRELEDNRYKQRRWRLWKTVRLACFGGVFAWWLLHYHENPVFIFYPLAAGLTATFADPSVRLRRDAVATLSRQDARMVGPLAVCLSDSDDAVRAMATEALCRLLPQVQREDRYGVTPQEMEALLKALNSKDDALIVATLGALAQIGDERALSAVEGLILHGRTIAIRRAARDCLPCLQRRADQSRLAQTLLRAAQIEPTRHADILVRPAARAEQTPPEQLLRSY